MVRVVIRPWPLSVAVWAIGTWPQGSASRASNRARRFSFTGSTNSPPCSWMWFAVAFTVCSASAVTILPSRSIWPSTTAAIGTSFVFSPTSACAATTEAAASGPTRAASSRTWFPSASFAPRIALPSSLTCISAGGQSSSPASRPAAAGAVNPARFISQRADRRVERPGVGIGQYPPDRGLRRRRGGSGTAAQVQIGQDRRRHVSDPAGDRGVALHPGHDRRRGQRQHGRNRMIPALARPAIRHPGEQFQQVTARIRYRDRHDRLCRCGRGSTMTD